MWWRWGPMICTSRMNFFFPFYVGIFPLQAHLARTLENINSTASKSRHQHNEHPPKKIMQTPSISMCQRAPRTADIKGVIRVHRLLVRPRRNPQEQRWDKGAKVSRYAKVESGEGSRVALNPTSIPMGNWPLSRPSAGYVFLWLDFGYATRGLKIVEKLTLKTYSKHLQENPRMAPFFHHFFCTWMFWKSCDSYIVGFFTRRRVTNPEEEKCARPWFAAAKLMILIRQEMTVEFMKISSEEMIKKCPSDWSFRNSSGLVE